MELPGALVWILVALLAAFSVYFISLNLACVYLGLFRGRHHSIGPLLGGGAGALALLLCPIPELHRWAWVPLVVDPGCCYAGLALAYAVVAHRQGGT